MRAHETDADQDAGQQRLATADGREPERIVADDDEFEDADDDEDDEDDEDADAVDDVDTDA